jgi:galactoside O-acetyltransferase
MHVKEELRGFFESIFVKHIPGKTGIIIRQLYWSDKFAISSNFAIFPGCSITSPGNIHVGNNLSLSQNGYMYAHNNGLIKIGNRVSINTNVLLGAADNGEIIIGDDVLIGPNVVLRASNHQYTSKEIPINKQGHTGGRIILESDVWIGANSVILPGAIIRKGTTIGAGSVVNKEIPEYALAAGIPAKVIQENYRK